MLTGSVAAARTVLEPTTTYTARLVAEGANEPNLASFTFTSSAFATFAHQIHSFNGWVWDSDAERDTPLPAFAQVEIDALQGAVSAGGTRGFDILARLFQLPTRPLPRSLEVTLLHDATYNWGFFVESPEPLDEARVSAVLLHHPTQVRRARHAGPVRLRDASFGDHMSTYYNDEWLELLVSEPCDLEGLRLEHVRDLGDRSAYSALATLGAGRHVPGDRIRIHAGRRPMEPPTDAVEHVYVTRDGGAPSWMLHPDQDEFRLIDIAGREISHHSFLAQFSAVQTAWIWNRDRTRVFVIPSVCAAGTYRIEWRYDLDISASDPEAPVLRVNARSDPEEAVTHFTV